MKISVDESVEHLPLVARMVLLDTLVVAEERMEVVMGNGEGVRDGMEGEVELGCVIAGKGSVFTGPYGMAS